MISELILDRFDFLDNSIIDNRLRIEKVFVLISLICRLQLLLGGPLNCEDFIIIKSSQHHGFLCYFCHTPVFVLDNRTAFELKNDDIMNESKSTKMPKQ